MTTQTVTLLQSYGGYVASQAQQVLSEDVQHHAKRALLDWMGSLIAGSDLPTADLLRKAYADELEGELITQAVERVAAMGQIAAIEKAEQRMEDFSGLLGDPKIVVEIGRAHV